MESAIASSGASAAAERGKVAFVKLAISCLVYAFICLAALAANPERALKVENSTFHSAGPGQGVAVELSLVNISRRTITAWAGSVEGHYPDGTTRTTQFTVDYISELLPAGAEHREFRGNTTRSESVMLPAGAAGALPVSVNATVQMVALDDDSALGDATLIRQLASERRSRARTMTELLEAVAQARHAPDAKAALKALVEKHDPKGRSIMWQQLRPDWGPAHLDAVISGYTATRDLLVQHSNLKEVLENDR